MLRRDPTTKTFSAEIKHRTFGRIHLSLRTTEKREAMTRHAALELLLNEGEPVRDLVEQLRKRQLPIEAVTACVREKLPFSSLRKSDAWPELGAACDAFVEFLQARDEEIGTTLGTARSTAAALRPARGFFGVRTRIDAIDADAIGAFRRFLSATKIDDKQDAETLAATAAAAWRIDRAAFGAAIGTSISGLGLKTNTISLYLTRLGAVYTWHQERETKSASRRQRAPRILYVPIDREEHVPAIVKTRVRFLYEEEAHRLLTATPDRWKFAIAGGFLAGFRIGETLNLRPTPFDVDLEQELFAIQTRDDWRPKHGVNREIPIAPELRPYLDRHLESYAGELLMHPGRDPHRPYDVRAFQRIVERIIEDAGLISGHDHPLGVTYHTLRHTFASWLVMEGVDLLTVARLLGHTTIKEVQATYGHLSPEHSRKAVEALGSRWASYLLTPAGASVSDAPRTQAETQEPSHFGGLRR